jgi:hypothetical protein
MIHANDATAVSSVALSIATFIPAWRVELCAIDAKRN